MPLLKHVHRGYTYTKPKQDMSRGANLQSGDASIYAFNMGIIKLTHHCDDAEMYCTRLYKHLGDIAIDIHWPKGAWKELD